MIVPCGIGFLKSVNSGVIMGIFCKYIDGYKENEQYAQGRLVETLIRAPSDWISQGDAQNTQWTAG